MKIISGITEFQLDSPSAIAIGKFDGVHLGHRLLLDRIIAASVRNSDLKSVVFTFNPSPESLFAGQALKELTTISEKRLIFDRMGVDVLIEFPMNHETAAIRARDFTQQYLVKRMCASLVVAGSDVTYGYMGEGNADTLVRLGREYDYECEIIDKVTYKGEPISSTRIRNAIEAGDMEQVTSMLGFPYRISGFVTHGRHIGHEIGMPTANVILAPDKLTGPNGVYYSRVYTADGVFHGITNVGVKPTIMNDELLCCESFLYDFDRDIYGEYIEVELLKFVRPERRFESLDELKEQMQSDIEGGRSFHHMT